MAESPSEDSSNLEVLEGSDEGKKKSKFKAFKSLFVKKKKKETEDGQGQRMLKSSLSSSNVNISSLGAEQEGELIDARKKSGMGNKALSHESIFMLDTEPDILASEPCASTEFLRGRTLRRSQGFKTLPRRGVSMHGAVPGVVPRSGVWVAGSKITEIPPLRPRQPSLSPPLIRSDIISKDLEEISVEDESLESPQATTSLQKILTTKTSLSDPSSKSDHSQSSSTGASLSSTQKLAGYSTLATTQSCLDSSAAQHKMYLNPRKQQKKRLQTMVEPNHEEPNFPMVSEGEKNTAEPTKANAKKVKIEHAESSGQEQSYKTAIYNQKAADKTTNTGAAGNPSNSVLAAHGKRRKTIGMCLSITDEYGPKGRSLTQFSQGHGLDSRAGSSSTNKTTLDGPSWHLPSEKQATEQLTTSQAEITSPQELLSDKSDMRRRNTGVDFEAKKALAPQAMPEDMTGSVEDMMGLPPSHEEGASVTMKTESGTSLLPVVERPSTIQNEDILLVTTDPQVLRDPFPIQSEEEEASSLDLQNAHSKAEDAPTVHQEKPPGDVLQACAVSVLGVTSTTTTAEGGISMETLPLISISQSSEEPETAKVSPDSKSMAEEGCGFERPLAMGQSFQSLQKPEDEQKVSQESENFVAELSSVEQQMALGYSSQFLRKPTAEKGSSELESIADSGSGSREVEPDHSSQSMEGPKVVSSESKSFIVEQPAPRCPSQEIPEPEDEEIPTGSNSYVKKYHNTEDWRSSGEGVPPRYTHQALVIPEGRREVPSVPENVWKEQMPSKHPTQSAVRPVAQQHTSPGSVSVCAGQHPSAEPVTPGAPFQPWVNPKFVQLVSADRGNVVEWGGFMEPPCRTTSKYLMNPKAEQKSSSVPGITSMEQVPMDVLSPGYPQPLTRSIVGQEASQYPASSAMEQRIYVALRPPSHAFQQWVSPQVPQQVFSSPENPAVGEGGIFVEPLPPRHLPQPLMNRVVHQSMSLGSEGVATEKVMSMEPQYGKYSLPNPQVQPIYSESTAAEQGIFVEQMPLGCHCQTLMQAKFQPQMSLDSASTSAQWISAVEPAAVRHACKMWMIPECKHQGSVGPQSTEVERGMSKEPVPPRHPVQPWLKPTFEQVSAGPENTPIEWSIPTDPQLPRMPSQPPRRSVVKQPVSTGPASASGQWSSPTKQMPLRHLFQPWASSTFQQQVSVGLESPANKEGLCIDLEPSMYYSQPPMRPIIKQEVSDSMSTSEEWCSPVGPIPSRHLFQPWVNPTFEQQVSAGPESVAIKGDIPRELPRHPSQTTMRQKVQKITSSSEESLSPKHSTYILVRSKDEEIPSTLKNTASEESISKTLLLPRSPTPSFVKFMTGQIFSEIPEGEGEIYTEPLSPNIPPKSFSRPEVGHQIFSDWGNADFEGGICSRHVPKSLRRPADPQEGLAISERPPMKRSSSKWQVRSRQSFEKLQYQQDLASVSDSSSEEWRSSEEQLLSRHPSEALHGSEFQPPTGSVNVPVGWSSPEEYQPLRHTYQDFGNTEYQQQVYSSSVSAAAGGTISENSPGSWSLPGRERNWKGPVPPKKTKKHSQGSEDFTKSIPIAATKPGKCIIAPTWKIPISEDIYYKEELLQSGDGNNDGHSSLPTNEADVENLSGVQLKRMSSLHKYKNEKPDSFVQLPSKPSGPSSSGRGREQQMRSGASQGLLSAADSLSTPSTFAEKHQSRPRYEGMAKRPPTKILGKPGWQSDYYVSDPAWFTMPGQKPKDSQVYLPVRELKTRSKAGATTEPKEPRHGMRSEATQKALQKGAGPSNETQPKKILTSSIHRQEKAVQMKSSKSTKSAAFEDQKSLRTSGTGKEMKRSLSLPSGLQYLDELDQSDEPNEPVWFSMAKKKAKAWSQIADIMQ